VTHLDAIEDARAEIEKYRRLLRRDPKSLRFAEYAERLRRAGQVADATAICARGLMWHPGYATGHAVMGEILRDAGLLDRAEQEWREALRLDPRHPRAHLCLGELYETRGDRALAVASFESALASNPQFAEAREKLAHLSAPRKPAEAGGLAATTTESKPAQKREARPLSEDQCRSIAAAVCRSGLVGATSLVVGDGTPTPGSDSSQAVPDSVVASALSLMTCARDIVSRLGAGRMRGIMLRGSGGAVRCTPLGDMTLVAALKPAAQPGQAATAIDAAIAGQSQTMDPEGSSFD
jgi:tetratricopeptide (TPR) repeat protein